MKLTQPRDGESSTIGHAGRPLLELAGVSVSIETRAGPRPILIDVNLCIGRGEILGLVGESGSGKSMTARAIIRSLPAGATSTGAIVLDGEDLAVMPRTKLRDIRADRIGVIFQDPRSAVDPLWTVEDHLTEGLRVHRKLTRDDARQRATDLLASVGISEPARRLRQYPDELSGGMLQRVVIAGALAGDPELIIADEPTTALDVTTQAEIVRIFHRLRDDRGLGMLFITHDLALAASLCDRVLVMYAGRIVDVRDREGIFRAPGHPYTHALVAARPSVEVRRPRLAMIPGQPTSAGDAPRGCAFHPRCGFAEARCFEIVPPLEPWDGGASACLRIDEIADALRG